MNKILTFLLFISIFQTTIAVATPATSVFLEELTWTELHDQINSGKTTIIIPIGGTEQNGPDMALGKHNERVKLLAQKIAQRLGNAIVAPVITYVPEGGIDPPTLHMRFPGTITIPNEAFQKTLEFAARSFKLHGFHDIVFLGDHGGYQTDEQSVAAKLNQEWASTPVRVQALPEYYQVTQNQYVSELKNKGYTLSEIGTHAGLADTSLMLALDPSLVRLAEIQNHQGKWSNVDGVYGDPSHASAKLGQLGVDLIVNTTVAAITKASKR